jgi:methoxymalonate biosynthesis acyl carrier protein
MSHNNNDTKARIRQFLSQHMQADELADQDDFFKKGYVNSLFAMQLVLFVENEFGCEVPDEDLSIKNFCSVDAIADYVNA